MLISKEVKVKWHGASKQHYINKGYHFTKTGDIFVVKTCDLTKGSHQEIIVKCDYQKEGCKDVYSIEFVDYLRNNINSNIHKDCCNNPNCMKEKRKESLQKTYGCENPNQITEAKEKRNKTCQELYGGNSPMCSSEVREKSIITLNNKYNVDNISQVDEIKKRKIDSSFKKFGVKYHVQDEKIKKKIANTNMNRYGVQCSLNIDGVHQKARQVCLDKYGVEHIMCLPEFQEKARQTRYKNGTTPTSSQQNYLSNLYKYNLNYLVGNCFLDMANVDEKIYIEYQGSGHNLGVKFGDLTQEEFDKKEINRGYFLSKLGWKRIEIISIKDKLPSDENLLLMLDYAKDYLSTNHSWIHFDIDNSKIITSQYKISVDFGKLRRIIKKDLEQIA